jgi:16S rRNA processing protein RimM
MDDRIKIGQIVNTHGIKGEVKCISLTDDIERFDDLEYIYIGNSTKKTFLENVRYAKNMIYIRFKGINTINEVEKYKGQYIEIDDSQKMKLPEDTYYLFDLIGLKVYDEEEHYLGEITNIYQTGANDVYELNGNVNQLIPAVKKIVKYINIKEKKMIINKIEGLLDEI